MGLWVILLALISYAGGLLTGWPLLQHLGYALALLVALSFVFALVSRRGVSASLLPDRLRAEAGEEIQETVVLRKRGLIPALWTWIDGTDGRRAFLGMLGGEERAWIRTRVFPFRGLYQVGGEDVRVGDPFGLFALRACTVEQSEVLVHPRPIPIPSESMAAALAELRGPRWRTEDASLGDLRHYVSGDPPSRIHWRSTARMGTLIVAPPESERGRSIWLAVDLGGGDEAADRTAGIATYLTQELTAARCQVGAFVAGHASATIPPHKGRDGSGRVLDALARVDAREASALDTLATVVARADRPQVVIVITPHVDDHTALQALRRRVGTLIVLSSRDYSEAG